MTPFTGTPDGTPVETFQAMAELYGRWSEPGEDIALWARDPDAADRRRTEAQEFDKANERIAESLRLKVAAELVDKLRGGERYVVRFVEETLPPAPKDARRFFSDRPRLVIRAELTPVQYEAVRWFAPPDPFTGMSATELTASAAGELRRRAARWVRSLWGKTPAPGPRG